MRLWISGLVLCTGTVSSKILYSLINPVFLLSTLKSTFVDSKTSVVISSYQIVDVGLKGECLCSLFHGCELSFKHFKGFYVIFTLKPIM